MPNPVTISELKPGDTIEFDNITQLPAFEDLVAQFIEGNVPPSPWELRMWGGRMMIGNLLRPNGYNGDIRQVRLTVMEEPYDRLYDARERGWKFGMSRPHNRSEDPAVAASYLGFLLTAVATSSGRGPAGGQIQAELYYGSVGIIPYTPKRRLIDGSEADQTYIYKSSTNGGSHIRRFVTKPIIEQEAMIALQEESRRIGFETLRAAMMHARTQTMRN